jgi:putative serine protease PepD
MTENESIRPEAEPTRAAETSPPAGAQPAAEHSEVSAGSGEAGAERPAPGESAAPAWQAAPTESYSTPPPSYQPGSYSVPVYAEQRAYSAPPSYGDQATYAGPGAYPAPPASGGPYGRRPSRLGKGLALGAAAVVLAASSGTIGAWTALELTDRPTATSSAGAGSDTSSPRAAAPVIQRDSLAQIAAKVQPSVVSIDTGTGEGSGVVLSADGYVLTNNHVVATARGNTVTVTFSDGKTAQATIVGTDPRTDLAVLKAQGVSGLTAATFGDSSGMEVGDTVLALGSPLGLEGSVTAGIISAKDRTIQVGGDSQESPFAPQNSGVTSIAGALQTDAAINPGNSGGALVNLSAEVIGINTAIATAGTSSGNIGVGFAIPSNRAKQVADQLIKGEKVSHPFLGVSVVAGQNGAVVDSVRSGSPADKAGLERGDVITKVDDTVIRGSDDVVSAVQSHKVGDRVEITYTRDGAQKTTTATLAEAS